MGGNDIGDVLDADRQCPAGGFCATAHGLAAVCLAGDEDEGAVVAECAGRERTGCQRGLAAQGGAEAPHRLASTDNAWCAVGH